MKIDRRTKLYRRTVKVIKGWSIVLLLLALFATLFGIAYAQAPTIEPVSPLQDTHVQIVEEEGEVAPLTGDLPLETPLTVDQIVDGIHMLESSRGTTGKPGSLQYYCEQKGMSNEYGYGGMKLKICFDSHELARERIVRWVNKHFEKFNLDLGKTLCYYNLGLEKSDCKYYQDFLEVTK